MTSVLEPLMGIWPNSIGMVPGWSPTKIVQMVLIDCISRSRGQKIGFHNAKSSCLKLQGPELSYLVYSIIQMFSTKVVQIMPQRLKLTLAGGSKFYIEIYKENFKRHLLSNCLWEFDQTQQEWSLGGLLPKLFKWFWLVAYVGHRVKK